MEETINIILLCNKLLTQTSYNNKRETLFRKFILFNLENISVRINEDMKLDTTKDADE